MHTIRIIGPGRAGTSLAAALSAARLGIRRVPRPRRRPVRCRAVVDVLVIATPDDAIAEVAAAVVPVDTTTVVHLWGRSASTPSPPIADALACTRSCRSRTARWVRPGSARASPSPWSASPAAHEMAAALGGRTVEVADEDRAAYHAAACIAANHVVALLGQVERVAGSVGLDLESFLPLTRAAVDDVADLGAQAALTGPARRGDWATLSRHLDALPESERAGYQAGAALATKLAGAADTASVPAVV